MTRFLAFPDNFGLRSPGHSENIVSPKVLLLSHRRTGLMPYTTPVQLFNGILDNPSATERPVSSEIMGKGEHLQVVQIVQDIVVQIQSRQRSQDEIFVGRRSRLAPSPSPAPPLVPPTSTSLPSGTWHPAYATGGREPATGSSKIRPMPGRQALRNHSGFGFAHGGTAGRIGSVGRRVTTLHAFDDVVT